MQQSALTSKQSQTDRLAKLLTRKNGVTAWEIAQVVGTVCAHKRLSDLKQRGWRITRQQIEGQRSGRYFGQPPKGAV